MNQTESQIVNPLEIDNWDSLVTNTPGTTFFHTKAWAQVLVHTYNFKPIYLIKQNDDRFSTLIPLMEVNSRLTGNRLVSLPFTDHCKLIAGQDEIDEIIKTIAELGREKKANIWNSGTIHCLTQIYRFS